MGRHTNGLIAIILFLLLFAWNELRGTRVRDKGNPTTTVTKLKSSSTTSRPYDGRPRVVFSEGCSGSTATLSMAAKIVSEHYGFPRHSLTSGEAYKPKKNTMYKRAKELLGSNAREEDVLEESFRLLHQDAINKKEIIIIKLHPSLRTLKTFFKDKLNATFSAMVRINAVDRSICMVRDCFESAFHNSHPVFANNGTQTDLCFQRRKLPHVKVMAYMDTLEFPKQVAHLNRESQRIARNFELEFSPFKAQTYEQLFAFEQTKDEGIYETSSEAWFNLVDPLIKGDVDVGIIERILRPQQGKHSPPSPHSTVIYNYEEASAALRKKEPGLAEEMLRG